MALKLPLAVVFTVVGDVEVAKVPMVMVMDWVTELVVPVKPRPVMVTTVSLPPEDGLMLMPSWVENLWVTTELSASAVLGPKAVRACKPLADSGTLTSADHLCELSAAMPVARSAPSHCTWMEPSLVPNPEP